uniref:Helicase ATP-binding domain-containing protein n=1 Tax=Pseudo-nitzschia australis TaxID=44445 RepID=A0A6U9VSV2_9STRA
MADELDDIFGAIDGDEEVVESEADEQIEEDGEEDEDANDSMGEPEDDEEKDGDNNSTTKQEKQQKMADTTTTKLYNSIMYAPTTTSNLRNDPQQKGASASELMIPREAVQKKKEEEAEQHAATNAVNTGTSHDKSVRSYSSYPKNLPEGMELPKPKKVDKPAKEYPFKLDPFQAQAIQYIDKEESVLVAAHTSAGKTAVAEYAIAKSLNNGQRVVYTSPIKALSNQKFRELQEEFGDVGLMTGDITINPTATCLVMTTEILRSMLYRGSELMREVAWVIYDEVHYMRDSERGVVWEESIILLPHRVRFVFLSATIPNAAQFADWICEIHHQPCHVLYTNYRPTPLQHYIFPQDGNGLHLVVDERGKFREANFQKAMASLQSASVDVAGADAMLSSGTAKKRKRVAGGKKGGDQMTGLQRIIKLIMNRNLNPVIIFSFSKKDCERFALALKREDYTDDVEKDLISQVYTNAIDSLGEDDQQLPQVLALLPLLKRGIGVHHGGLLPILKEVVEILFAEGLIKTLFATETFAIGINMPAKTVVFTNTRKFDGQDFRWVTSGEYIQMSGRAGRRGKDDRGLVIQMLDEKMEPAICKGILYGDPDPLNSSYRISYNMLLNLMRVEDVEPEYLLRASFHQFQREKDAPALIAQAEDFMTEAENLDLGSEEEVELAKEYYKMDQQLLLTKRKVTSIAQKPKYIVKFLQVAGRFLDVSIDGEHYGWGVLTSFKKRGGGSAGEAGKLASLSNRPTFTIEVLLPCVDRHFDSVDEKARKEDTSDAMLLWRGTSKTCRPQKSGVDDEKLISMRVFTIGLEHIDRVSAVRIFTPNAIQTPEARKKVAMAVKEVQKRFPEGIPLLDPIKDLKIKDENFTTLMERADALSKRLIAHKLAVDFPQEDRVRLIKTYEKQMDLKERSRMLREEARSFQTMAMKDDLKKMKRVLKKLGHVDSNGVIQTKGRTACEINTADELVVTELIFTGVFKTLTVEQCVALLSTMTFGEPIKDADEATQGMKSFLLNPFYKLQEVAKTVVQMQISCNLDVDEDEFLNKFNPAM